MKREHAKGPDGLPEPVKGKVVVRALSILPATLASLSILILLQQMGRVLVTVTGVVVAILIGAMLGILIPTLAHIIAAGRLNSRVARARSGTQTKGGA